MQTVEQRLAALEQAMNTLPSTLMNVTSHIIDVLVRQPSFDREEFRQNLEDLKNINIQGGNARLNEDVINFFLQNLSRY